MDRDTEFEKVDREVEVLPRETALEKSSERRIAPKSSVVAYRDSLIQKYHGADGLIERLRKSGRDDAEALVLTLIDEVVKETDHLLGNELVATENGELRDASIISFKRSEVLEKAIKAVQAKMAFERESGIDIDSPLMMVVFRFFMSKVKSAFVQINSPDEQSDLFFKTLGESMKEWKKELKAQIGELKGSA